MKLRCRLKEFLVLALVLIGIEATANETILSEMSAAARKENPSFTAFSQERGEKIFRAERISSKGEKISCMTCHTPDPKAFGRTRANKEIEPLAPIANPQRFTDSAKVEKWFARNCKDVLERACTAQEKGDFTKYLMSIK
jgi:cytochrome c peroxidase